MKKYKYIENEFIPYIGKSSIVPTHGVEIDQAEYDDLMGKISEKPDDTLESVYRLSAETNQYIACPRTQDETVQWYTDKVISNEMEVADVPEDYRSEVEAMLPQPIQSPEYQAGYNQAVLDLLEVKQ